MVCGGMHGSHPLQVSLSGRACILGLVSQAFLVLRVKCMRTCAVPPRVRLPQPHQTVRPLVHTMSCPADCQKSSDQGLFFPAASQGPAASWSLLASLGLTTSTCIDKGSGALHERHTAEHHRHMSEQRESQQQALEEEALHVMLCGGSLPEVADAV